MVHNRESQDETSSTNSSQIVGWLVVIAAVVSVFAMMNHPTGHGHGALNVIVHGSMLTVLFVWMLGYASMSLHLGMQKPLVLGGLIAYFLGSLAHMMAATTNGFVAPAMVAHGGNLVGHDILILCWEFNQKLAMLGVYGTGMAFVLFSIHLLLSVGWSKHLLGALGLLAGIAPVGILIANGSAMNVHTALIVYSFHAMWTILIGITLIRARCRINT